MPDMPEELANECSLASSSAEGRMTGASTWADSYHLNNQSTFYCCTCTVTVPLEFSASPSSFSSSLSVPYPDRRARDILL